jgi:hypothetical protein
MKIVTRRKKRWLRRSVPGVLRQEPTSTTTTEWNFADVGQGASVAGSGKAWGTGCAFIDYDRNGHLDLMVANQVDPSTVLASRQLANSIPWQSAAREIPAAAGFPITATGPDEFPIGSRPAGAQRSRTRSPASSLSTAAG